MLYNEWRKLDKNKNRNTDTQKKKIWIRLKTI
jgi:hypothetical protein